jgi:hypothetical protein
MPFDPCQDNIEIEPWKVTWKKSLTVTRIRLNKSLNKRVSYMTNLTEGRTEVQLQLEQRYRQAAVFIVTPDCHF